jgi:hypothetical protein
MKKISYYFNKFPNLMYFLVPCTIIFILGISLGSVEGLDKQRAKSFIGGSPNTIINRIGSLSIGSLVPATWLSDNTSSDFRKSCINKWTTSRASDRGIETCLDIRGGAAFDALFVNQPAYLIGKVVLNNTFINADPSGLVIGTEGHSGNSILVSEFSSSNQAQRKICANSKGEIFVCGEVQDRTLYQWHEYWGACEDGKEYLQSTCIKSGGSTEELFSESNCIRDDGPKPTGERSCNQPNPPISWQEPTKRCENGKVISTWYVTGNEGRLVQFRRSQNDAWLDATIGVNGIEIEVPKEEETVGAEDRFCKTLYYRVPDLPNKNKNDVTNGIWGCVDTFNKQECPDN